MFNFNNIRRSATLFVCAFFMLVLAVSFLAESHYPQKVVSGEASVGTWLSNTLLVMAAVITMLHALQKRRKKWLYVSAFCMFLALDEHFMFHERAKEYIIFKYQSLYTLWPLMCELPVVIGALFGFVITVILWQLLGKRARLLLLLATVLGCFSVCFDIFNLGVFWEDSAKLLAELLFVCSLIQEIDYAKAETH